MEFSLRVVQSLGQSGFGLLGTCCVTLARYFPSLWLQLSKVGRDHVIFPLKVVIGLFCYLGQREEGCFMILGSCPVFMSSLRVARHEEA